MMGKKKKDENRAHNDIVEKKNWKKEKGIREYDNVSDSVEEGRKEEKEKRRE